jgi:hypothetical protein
MELALLIKPFVAIIFLGLIVLPIAMLIDKFWPDSKLKRFMFKKRG